MRVYLIKLTFVISLLFLFTFLYRKEEVSYREASFENTTESYESFIQTYPKSKYRLRIKDKIESVAFFESAQKDTINAYRQYLKKFPNSIYKLEILNRIETLSYNAAVKKNTLDAFNHFLGQYQHSKYRADVIKRRETLENELTAKKDYTLVLTSSSPYKNILDLNPLAKDISLNKNGTTNRSYKEIKQIIDQYYNFFELDPRVTNNELRRFHKFVLTYDLLSRLRFKQGVSRLPNQREIYELIDHIIKSDWYVEFLVRKTQNPAYEFMENHALQIIIAMHTAAHYFQLPYPTYFCLIFQESKFDLKITSPTGAIGLGQLTSVGLDQVKKLRKKRFFERRLQAATEHIGQVYRDPIVLRLLKDYGYKPVFPDIESFPKSVNYNSPDIVTPDIVSETAHELLVKGYKYAKDQVHIKSLCQKLVKGFMLPERYAPVHPAFKKAVERKYRNSLGSILNTETNLFYSAMLLKYYMDYKWRINGKEIFLQPTVRALAAAVAYNEGERGVLGYFSLLKHDFPFLNLSTAKINDLTPSFTLNRIKRNHPSTPLKSIEIFEHAWAIRNCSYILE